MATRSCSQREAVASVSTSLLLLLATLANAQINGTLSNTSNSLATTAADLGLPEGLTVLVLGEQSTVEVAWESATPIIGNTSFVLELTSQLNGEQIAYREVGGDGMEGRVSLSGIQLGEDYSLTVYSTDGRLNSSEVFTFSIQPGSSDAFVCPYLEVFVAILSLVLLAVLAAACLIACITCIRSGCRGIGGSRKKKQTVMSRPSSAAKGKRRDKKSTTPHTSNKTIGSSHTAMPSGGHRASLQMGGYYNPSSHAYDSLEYNTYLDFALEENPAYNVHGHANNDGEDPYMEVNPAYNLSTGQVQGWERHQKEIVSGVDCVPLEANPAYNLPVSAHMDDLGPLLESNPAYGLCPSEELTQNADPVLQDNPAYIRNIQSPVPNADSGDVACDGGDPNSSLYDFCEYQSSINSDVTLEDNPAYDYLPNQGPAFLPSNKIPQMHQPREASNIQDPNSIPLQDNPSYSTTTHLGHQ